MTSKNNLQPSMGEMLYARCCNKELNQKITIIKHNFHLVKRVTKSNKSNNKINSRFNSTSYSVIFIFY